MAGHSKWANIQHRKGRQDAKRGRLFSKLIREVTIASKLGGSNLSGNPRLRIAIDQALSNNVTKDAITRAIKRGAGNEEAADIDEIRYEGYSHNGVAIMVDCITDNKNRTVAEVRQVFNKFGGRLSVSGSVSYLFDKVGIITFPGETDEDTLIEVALNAGADDIITNDDGTINVFTAVESFTDVKQTLADAHFNIKDAIITMHPRAPSELDLQGAQAMLKLLDALENLGDVQQIYLNAKITDAILARLD